MSNETVKIPDLGGGDGVEVIEICVAVGDSVAAEDSLVVLESDKASMEVPAPFAGAIVEILVKEGDQVSEGDDLVVVERDADSSDEDADDADQNQASAADAGDDESVDEAPAAPPAASATADEDAEQSVAAETRTEQVAVPDIGGDSAEVIEICVAQGDDIAEGDAMIVLETDKASMEVPAPSAGKVVSIAIKEGDQAQQGTAILELEIVGGQPQTSTADAGQPEKSAPAESAEQTGRAPEKPAKPSGAPTAPAAAEANTPAGKATGDKVYAGPAVRRLAREFGVTLDEVRGSGPRSRILKEDLQNHVKSRLSGDSAATTGSGIAPIPEVDFAAFGEIETRKLTGMEKATAVNMHRSWVNVPHVTHFDEADITELESFRKSMKAEAEQRDIKLTPMPFLLKACAVALRENPRFCASIQNGEWIQKKYCHIGMAVDTPAGLLVPVLRDVDKKTIWELSAEIVELAGKARDRKLKPDEMKGGCFTISSLGNIGGSGFTPVVNAPELGILGVSKAAVKPVWNGSEFAPRTMLPLCLSYDHRGINGGDAGRFMTFLVAVLSDIRRLVL